MGRGLRKNGGGREHRLPGRVAEETIQRDEGGLCAFVALGEMLVAAAELEKLSVI